MIRKRLFTFFIILVCMSYAAIADAVCSPYAGMASFNEFFKDRANMAADSDDFVEIKILNQTITSTIYNNWTLQVCEENDSGNNNDADGCSAVISVSSFTETTPPWLVLRGSSIGQHINFRTGFDAILKDQNDDVIDYLSVDGYNPLEDGTCPGSSLPFDTTASAPGASDKFIFRSPDGTGDWNDAQSASEPPTEDGNNDDDENGNPAPAISVTNPVVFKGETATFSLSITNTQSYNITVQYTTQNATAVAGTDYTSVSGTATITAGSTSTTVNVATIAGSTSGEVNFYLYLSNPVNGSIANHYPTGTILPDPIADWQMDEVTWNSTANEVVDSSDNGNHGTTVNNLANTNAYLCNGGSFDGVNDYIALPGFSNLTGSFTITAWINPDVVNKDQRIFADDESNSNGYAFSLGDGGNGRLRFFSRNISPVSLDTTAVINPGNWYHVVAVHNVTTKTRQIYVNGAAVTASQTYTGSWGTDSGTASIGGETNSAGSEAVSNWRFDGRIDEVLVFQSALPAAGVQRMYNNYQAGFSWNGSTRTCPSAGLHHLEIQHDGTGLTCEPETITVRACANSSCTSLYSSDVNVTFTPTGWVGGDTQNVTGGQSTFQFRNTSASTVTYGVSNSAPSASSALVCLNTATAANDCSQTFYDTGFIYTIPTQTSCATSNAITISAVRLDNTSQACVPTFVSQTRNLDFSLAYANPNTGTRDLTLNYNGTDYTPINASTSQTVPISFDSNGQANFTVTYPDAGQITLNSVYTGSAGTGDAGLTMNGGATYVTKPDRLYVFADEANSACAGSVSSCSAFKRAGENFNLKVRGACADNTVTPNFQLTNIAVTHTNTAPAIAQGTLGTSSFDMLAADNGEHTIVQTVSEVGAYTFTATPPAYFGETIGTAVLNTSSEIGRFYPDHFCLTGNSISNRTDSNSATGCTDNFSYLDEEFTANFSLRAQAMGSSCASADITQNYHADWSKFSSPFDENVNLPAEAGEWNIAAANDPAVTPTDLRSRISINTTSSTPANGQFTNGQITATANLTIIRSGSAPTYTVETPFTDVHIGINPVDLDNVEIDSTDLIIATDNYRDIGNTDLFFGRLFAENAYGTNQSDLGLDMYARTEFCNAVTSGNCTDWQTKTDDSCTLYNISAPADTALGNTTAGDGQGYYQRASASVSSSVFAFDDDGAATSYARVHVADTNNHHAGWRLFYTAGGNGGDYVIPFQFPFNGDPAVHPYLLHLDGIASFGQFRGDDRIIYWREILQ